MSWKLNKLRYKTDHCGKTGGGKGAGEWTKREKENTHTDNDQMSQ